MAVLSLKYLHKPLNLRIVKQKSAREHDCSTAKGNLLLKAGPLVWESGTGGCGLVMGLAELDLMLLKVFFKLNISVILCLELTYC